MVADPEPGPGPGVAVASELLRARLARPRATIPRRSEPLSPLTATQQGIWYDAQLAPEDPAHHRTTVVALRGPLDRGALQQALDAVVSGQSCLRTCYPMSAGVPMQRVLAPGSVPIREVDATRDAFAAGAVIDAASTTVFDLEHRAPLAATLVEHGANEHQLVLALSHLAIDGPSAVVLVDQLADAYAAVVAGLPVPSLPRARFGDWVAWRAEQQDDEVRDQQLTWWSLFLAGRSGSTPLPDEFTKGDGHPLPDDVVSRLRALARAESVTMNAVVMAAAATLAWEELGIDDLVVGMPVTDRDHPDVEDVVGCFMRVLPVRLRLGAGETRRELLGRTGATLNVVLDHRAVAMPEILWTVAPRDGSGHVVDVVDAFVQYRRDRDRAAGPRHAAGVQFELVDLGSLDAVPTVEVRDDGVGLGVTSAMLADHLRRMADDPDRLLRTPQVGPSSRACPTGPNLDPDLPGTTPSDAARAPALDATVGSLFAETEREHAGRTAIRDGDRSVAFAELGGLGREVAEQLAMLGIGPGHTVGVQFPRCVEGIAAMLGVVLSGAAYVPVDDQAPPARVQTVVEDARLSALVSPSGIERLSADALPLPVDVGPRAPAYVMYTSGSTGRPKGVVVHHRAVVQLACDRRYVGYGPDDVIAYASNPAFDTATLEVWGALLNGACLAVVTPEVLIDPDALGTCLAEYGITTLHPTTSLFHALVRRRPGLFSGLRLLSVGGEAADPSLVRTVVAAGPPIRFVNDYGPTEATTTAAYFDITEVPEGATSVPIGRPLAAGSLHVLDRRGRPVPAGVPGELAIGGDGVALGYLGRPELTAERFVPDPFSVDPGARMYLTGDMVYARPDGLVEFLGRVDTQVKVRGFRIELGEIESAMTTRPDIDQAAVVVWRDGGDASIVAYAVPAEGQSVDPTDVVAGLRAVVPAYMVPDRVVALDELPVTPNGKVDRRALPSLNLRAAAGGSTADARDDLEVMRGVWCSVLDLPVVDPDAEFFDIGGHSLRALLLLAAVEDSFGVDLRLADLVAAPTPRLLTAAVLSRDRVHHAGGLIELNAGVDGGPTLHLIPAGVVVRYVSDYQMLVRHLPSTARVVTYEVPGLAPGTLPMTSIGRLAGWYAERVAAAQPEGPLVICGHSVGGIIAVEVARRLVADGRTVARVVLLDARLRQPPPSPAKRTRVLLTGTARRWRVVVRARLARTDAATRSRQGARDLAMATQVAFVRYRPSPYGGAVTLLITPVAGAKAGREVADEWRPYLADAQVVDVEGAHSGEGSLLDEPHVARTAEVVAAALVR